MRRARRTHILRGTVQIECKGDNKGGIRGATLSACSPIGLMVLVTNGDICTYHCPTMSCCKHTRQAAKGRDLVAVTTSGGKNGAVWPPREMCMSRMHVRSVRCTVVPCLWRVPQI